jgi:hypothetical protein
MFNVMLYVAFMLNEALTHTQRKYDGMRNDWDNMVQGLAAARAAAVTEQEQRVKAGEALHQFHDELQAYKESTHSDMADMQCRCKVSPPSCGWLFPSNCTDELLQLTGPDYWNLASVVTCKSVRIVLETERTWRNCGSVCTPNELLHCKDPRGYH